VDLTICSSRVKSLLPHPSGEERKKNLLPPEGKTLEPLFTSRKDPDHYFPGKRTLSLYGFRLFLFCPRKYNRISSKKEEKGEIPVPPKKRGGCLLRELGVLSGEGDYSHRRGGSSLFFTPPKKNGT